MSLYFLGVHTVLSALQAAGKTALRRYAGASSGAQTPFELVLAGEDATLDTYLSHGLLADRYAPSAGFIQSMYNADRHWHAYAEHLMDTHGQQLSKLDERVFVSVSVIGWSGLRNALYSTWSERGAAFAKEAFYATGTLLTKCDGRWCTDGGVTNNTPTFTDGARPQLLVKPTSSGLPLSRAVRFSFAEAIEAIERGQDDAIEFFGRDHTKSCAALKLLHPTSEPSTR